MNEQDWIGYIPQLSDATPEDLETATMLLGLHTLPAEIAEGEAVQRLVQLEVLQVRRASGEEDYEIAKFAKGPGFKDWPVERG